MAGQGGHYQPVNQADQIEAEDEGVADVETASSTASLRTSLLEPVFQHGRQYHKYKDGQYHRPNDKEELERLDMMGAIFSIVNQGKLHRAPLPEGIQRVLDVGTGTGAWAIEMGDKYTNAEILGVDLSPSTPAFVPPNVKFEITDVEDEWTYHDKFDFIHCRYMTGAIKDWAELIKKSFDNIEPGGWAEFADLDIDYYSQDGSLKEEHALVRWMRIAAKGMDDFGQTMTPGKRLEGWMRDAGFENIQVVRNTLPVGKWPKDKTMKMIGTLNFVQLHEGLTGMNVRLFLDFLGWSRQDLDILLMQVQENCRDPSIHILYDMYTVWGQKPQPSEVPP